MASPDVQNNLLMKMENLWKTQNSTIGLTRSMGSCTFSTCSNQRFNVRNHLQHTFPMPSPTNPCTYDLFPCSDRSCHAEDHLHCIHEWFGTTECPVGLTNTAYATFLCYTEYFFQTDGHLWRRDLQGHHKVVINCDKQPEILAATHNTAGHHRDFTTHAHIIDHFGGLTSPPTLHGSSGPVTYVNFAKPVMSSFLW